MRSLSLKWLLQLLILWELRWSVCSPCQNDSAPAYQVWTNSKAFHTQKKLHFISKINYPVKTVLAQPALLKEVGGKENCMWMLFACLKLFLRQSLRTDILGVSWAEVGWLITVSITILRSTLWVMREVKIKANMPLGSCLFSSRWDKWLCALLAITKQMVLKIRVWVDTHTHTHTHISILGFIGLIQRGRGVFITEANFK